VRVSASADLSEADFLAFNRIVGHICDSRRPACRGRANDLDRHGHRRSVTAQFIRQFATKFHITSGLAHDVDRGSDCLKRSPPIFIMECTRQNLLGLSVKPFGSPLARPHVVQERPGTRQIPSVSMPCNGSSDMRSMGRRAAAFYQNRTGRVLKFEICLL
jgi:hypothetical protein